MLDTERLAEFDDAGEQQEKQRGDKRKLHRGSPAAETFGDSPS